MYLPYSYQKQNSGFNLFTCEVSMKTENHIIPNVLYRASTYSSTYS